MRPNSLCRPEGFVQGLCEGLILHASEAAPWACGGVYEMRITRSWRRASIHVLSMGRALKNRVRAGLLRAADAVHDMAMTQVDLTWRDSAFLIVTAPWALYWISYTPSPGYAVALMAWVAVLMAAKEQSKAEKTLWLIIAGVLLYVELVAIHKDRSNYEDRVHYARVLEQIQFQRILRQSQKQFDVTVEQQTRDFNATMSRSDKVLGLQQRALGGLTDTVNTLTGDESFAYLWYVPGQAFLSFAHKGTYPLYGVSARIVDLGQIAHNLSGTNIAVGDMTSGLAYPVAIPPGFPASGDHFNANVFFTARNGVWTELFRARRVSDGWAVAIRVTGGFTSLKKWKIMCEQISPDFPRDVKGGIEGFTPSGIFGPMLPCQ